MDKNISDTIVSICKQLGIDYKSCNPNYVAFANDAKRLGQIILELNSLTDELEQMLQRHNIGLAKKIRIRSELRKLHDLDHDLFKLAKRIQEETKKKEKNAN